MKGKEDQERQRQEKEEWIAQEETVPFEISGIRPLKGKTIANRRKAKQCHPDKHPGASKEKPSAVEEF